MAKKGFHMPACLGGSKTTGEAEMASGPATPPVTDKIKAKPQAQQLTTPPQKAILHSLSDSRSRSGLLLPCLPAVVRILLLIGTIMPM